LLRIAFQKAVLFWLRAFFSPSKRYR
jgi:hypothetical protein